MMDLKPYGAFIENTLRPMIEEAQILLSDLHGYGLYFCKEDISKIVKLVANKHLKATIINAIRDVIIALIIAGVLWKIYPSVSR